MTKTVTVTQVIEVTVDETKFTPEFMANFSRYLFELEDVEDHIKYIATGFARGVIAHSSDFLEGYGQLSNFGVKVERHDTECEIDELD